MEVVTVSMYVLFQILPGLYVGNIRDAKDLKQLTDNLITHLISIHDHAQRLHDDRSSLVILAQDNQSQDLLQHVAACNDYIHMARLAGGSILVHWQVLLECIIFVRHENL